jgi:hypothetical protein
MTDHIDAPPELMPLEPMPLEPCDCCGVPVSYRRGSIWHHGNRICRPCFYIWYDDAEVWPARIKAIRLARYGTLDTDECR